MYSIVYAVECMYCLCVPGKAIVARSSLSGCNSIVTMCHNTTDTFQTLKAIFLTGKFQHDDFFLNLSRRISLSLLLLLLLLSLYLSLSLSLYLTSYPSVLCQKSPTCIDQTMTSKCVFSTPKTIATRSFNPSLVNFSNQYRVYNVGKININRFLL